MRWVCDRGFLSRPCYKIKSWFCAVMLCSKRLAVLCKHCVWACFAPCYFSRHCYPFTLAFLKGWRQSLGHSGNLAGKQTACGKKNAWRLDVPYDLYSICDKKIIANSKSKAHPPHMVHRCVLDLFSFVICHGFPLMSCNSHGPFSDAIWVRVQIERLCWFYS